MAKRDYSAKRALSRGDRVSPSVVQVGIRDAARTVGQEASRAKGVVVMVVRSIAASLAENSAILLRLIVVDSLDGIGLIQFMRHAVKNWIPHILRRCYHDIHP